MGRTRKVNRETARLSALSAFWINGYSSLGVRKIEELTGINRFALQTEFGGKNGLFLEVVSLYASEWNRMSGNRIREGNLEDLAGFFLRRTRKGRQEEMNKGCLILNMLGGDQPDAPEIRQLISKFLEDIQASFASAIKNEKKQGTLIEGLNIEESSQMLLSALIGINLLIKENDDNKAARPTALFLEKTIMGWRKPA